MGLALGMLACANEGGADRRESPEAGDAVAPVVDLVSDQDGAPESSFSYGCDREYRFVARLLSGGEAVRLILPDTTVTLPRVVSASGAKYGDAGFTYWSRGDEAMIETPELSFAGCVSDDGGPGWREARERGVRFRAIGQEPFWNLEIGEDAAVTIEEPVNETRSHFPPAAASEVEAGEKRTVYRYETGAHRATIVIVGEPCRDAMSGWPYEATVSLTLDGRELDGCGRWL